MKALILSFVMALGLTTMAFPSAARPGFMGGDPMEHIERIAERLELSAEQEEQIAGILNSRRTDSAEDSERLRQIREEMRGLMENFEEGRAQSLADEIGQITARQTYASISTMSQVYSVLTPEQRIEMGEMREKRRDRMESRHGLRRQ